MESIDNEKTTIADTILNMVVERFEFNERNLKRRASQHYGKMYIYKTDTALSDCLAIYEKLDIPR